MQHSRTSSGKKLRIVFLTVMPSPYIEEMFAALAAQPGLELHVLYMEMEAPDTHWGHRELPVYAEILDGKWFSFLGGRIHRNPGVKKRLAELDADVYVVAGYSSFTAQAAIRWLNRQRRPWIFWGEIPGMEHRNWLGTTLRAIVRNRALKGPSAIAAIGSHAVKEYRRLTKNRVEVQNLPYHCDVEPFIRARNLTPIKDELVCFLYCGQLIERKGVDLLLTAFMKVAEGNRNCQLTFVGTGELQPTLCNQVPEGLQNRIHFAGFVPVTELPAWFVKANVFVLPSRHDGWGVVVNQAIAAGLPVICSDAVGAGNDLVHHGENGFRVNANNQLDLQQALQRFVDQPQLIHKYSRRSVAEAENWTLKNCAMRWIDLAERILSY